MYKRQYLDYKIHADNGSTYNTPNCFAIYIAGEVFKHIKDMGGIAEMNRRNVAKAKKLYDFIDSSELYKCPVEKEDRSLMNVVFVTGDGEPVSYTHLDVYKRQWIFC